MKVIKAARSNKSSLFQIIDGLETDSVPANLRADCFDVFHLHLQKPINHDLHEVVKWVFGSFSGIATLGLPYFASCADNKQRFTRCWPDVIKWLKVIFDGSLFHGSEQFYYFFTLEAYDIARSVCEDLLEEDGAFEFAVTAWNGHVANGVGHFSVRPILAYLACKILSISRINYLLSQCENDPDRLVASVLLRLRFMTSNPNANNTIALVDLATMMGHLADLNEKSIRMAVFTPITGPLFVSLAFSIVMDATLSTDHLVALRSLFHLIYGCAQLGPACARAMVGEGILVPLLKWAAFESRIDPDPRCSRPCDVLRLLSKHLVFNDTVELCRNDFHHLYSTCNAVQPMDLLRTSCKEFQDTWQAFWDCAARARTSATPLQSALWDRDWSLCMCE